MKTSFLTLAIAVFAVSTSLAQSNQPVNGGSTDNNRSNKINRVKEDFLNHKQPNGPSFQFKNGFLLPINHKPRPARPKAVPGRRPVSNS